MDDQEDDARYPHNPYPSIQRPKFPFRNYTSLSEIRRRFPKNDEDYDDQNDIDRSTEEEKEDDDKFDDEDSSESRGKRRKLDELALAFEFAPRAAATSAASPPAPAARNSPTEWLEHSTFALLEAWGDRYIRNGRKSLRPNEWIEVSKNVSQALRISLSNSQCQNRLGTLKKKYKKEKARMAEPLSSKSKWVYFKRMDELISSPSPPTTGSRQRQQNPKIPCGIGAWDSPGDGESVDEEESDGLPRMARGKGLGNSVSSLFGVLADSVLKFGEIYERIENCKRQQIAELERMRKEFQRDLEVHKRKILVRAKAEIEKIRQCGDDEENDDESLSG